MGARGPAASRRLLARLRIVHPFPSTLDGVVAGAIAAALGAPWPDAARLGISMVLLQGAIGAANDLVDAPADAVAKPWKPIPAGLVGASTVRRLAAGLAIGGLALAAPSGPAVLAIAATGLATGLLYDLRFKGTPASWVPFAVGIPLLPLYGALGAAATGALVPPGIGALCLLAIPAGAGLAIANAAADVTRDREAGTGSIATALGHGRAWALGAVAVGGTALLALGIVVAGAAGGPPEPPGVPLAAVGAAVAALGILLGRPGAASRGTRGVLGWELQAVGLGLVALAWVVGRPPG